jgi:hypothetical protein
VFRKKKKEPLFDSGPEAFHLLMKEAVMKEFLDEQEINVPYLNDQANYAEGSAANPPATTSTKARGAKVNRWKDRKMVERHKSAQENWRHV